MKKLLALLSIGLIIAVLTVMVIPAQASTPACTKIKLCHGTSSDSNPYGPKAIEIDDDAIVTSGHSGHTGPLWSPGITTVWGDIIPPFDYGDGQHYDGMNWSAEGQAIWNNNCQIVTPTKTPTNVPTSTFTPTSIPEDTPTPENTPTSIPEDTPTPENTPTSIPEDTPTPENTPTSIPEDTPTPENTPTSEETPVPSSTPQVETPNPPNETETPVVEVEVNTGGSFLAPGLTLIGLLGIAGIQLIGRRRK